MISKKIVLLTVVSVFLSATNGCPLSPAPVQRTGQTNCFDEEGVKIACSGTGQDGEYQKGVEWPNPRFTVNDDGTVSDNLTGLIWLKDANCFGERTWQEALDDCNYLSTGGCGLFDGSSAGDWRLPNRFEFESLLDISRYSPALPSGHPFINVQYDHYWSSSTYAWPGSNGSAWSVYLDSGDVDDNRKSYYEYVWPVRGGQ